MKCHEEAAVKLNTLSHDTVRKKGTGLVARAVKVVGKTAKLPLGKSTASSTVKPCLQKEQHSLELAGMELG